MQLTEQYRLSDDFVFMCLWSEHDSVTNLDTVHQFLFLCCRSLTAHGLWNVVTIAGMSSASQTRARSATAGKSRSKQCVTLPLLMSLQRSMVRNETEPHWMWMLR